MELNENNFPDIFLKETADYVSDVFKGELKDNVYYNYELSFKIVELSQIIGEENGLNSEEKEVVQIAAWFTYISYSKKKIVEEYLSSKKYPQTKKVLNLIESILSDKKPEKNIEKVLWDAHYAYLANSDFLKQNELFRKQLEISERTHSDIEWFEKTQRVFVKHSFYTDYAKDKFEELKESNYQKVVKFFKKLQKMQDAELEKMLKIDAGELKDLKKKLSKIENRPERGVETLYRLASKNLYTRLTMVDNKGNILISINAIIISLTIGSVMGRLEEDPHLLIPIIVLLITNLASILFAILATRPPKTKGVFNPDQITNNSANLLSFDNFFNMKREEYHKNMDLIANNAEALYSNITEDIYTMGIRLGKKYHFLRYSYNIFLFGLMLAVVGFLLCHLMYEI